METILQIKCNCFDEEAVAAYVLVLVQMIVLQSNYGSPDLFSLPTLSRKDRPTGIVQQASNSGLLKLVNFLFRFVCGGEKAQNIVDLLLVMLFITSSW